MRNCEYITQAVWQVWGDFPDNNSVLIGEYSVKELARQDIQSIISRMKVADEKNAWIMCSNGDWINANHAYRFRLQDDYRNVQRPLTQSEFVVHCDDIV